GFDGSVPDAGKALWPSVGRFLAMLLAVCRQSVEVLWRASARSAEIQPMLAQFVVQGLARYTQCFGQAAQRTMRATQLGGDQRALEGFHLRAAPAVGRWQVRCVAVQRELQAKGETLGGVLQFAHVARPWMTQQQRTLSWLQFARGQGM